jgi:hypothetical protein
MLGALAHIAVLNSFLQSSLAVGEVRRRPWAVVLKPSAQAVLVASEVYWLAAGAGLSAAHSEKPILACAALEIISKYFWSSPKTIAGLHWGVQLKVYRSVPRCRLALSRRAR